MRDVDGVAVYDCYHCRDVWVVLSERKHRDGHSLGTYSRPCVCLLGESVRRSWDKPDSRGKRLSDTAIENTRKLQDAGAV